MLTLPAAPSWDRAEKPHVPRFVTRPAAEAVAESSRPRTALGSRHTTHPHPTRPPHPDQHVATHPPRRPRRPAAGTVPRHLQPRESPRSPPAHRAVCPRPAHSGAVAHPASCTPRLTTEPVSDTGLLLVVETSDTFDSLVQVLTDNPGNVGLVGWGAGSAFEASIPSIGRLGRTITEIRYFGDLDAKGLRIPAAADRTARDQGFPPVQPAHGLYTAMFHPATPQPTKSNMSKTTANTFTTWLPENLRDRAIALLAAGERLAQEAVGLANLSRNTGWRSD